MRELIIHGGFPRFRFSLRTLMEILTLVAVGIGAYLVGNEKGNHEGYRRGAATVSLEYQKVIARVEKLRGK